MTDGGVSHFSKMALQREEEEELRASRLSGFGTDAAFSYFLFVSVLLFCCFVEYIVSFSQWGLIPRMRQPAAKGGGLCVICIPFICLLSAFCCSVLCMFCFCLHSHHG
jgi:hypothetical protein